MIIFVGKANVSQPIYRNAMKRRMRLNLSVDHATYRRAATMARRLGFRSACAMTGAMLGQLVNGDEVRGNGDEVRDKGEGNIFDGFSDFSEYSEWERQSDKAGNIRGRKQ